MFACVERFPVRHGTGNVFRYLVALKIGARAENRRCRGCFCKRRILCLLTPQRPASSIFDLFFFSRSNLRAARLREKFSVRSNTVSALNVAEREKYSSASHACQARHASHAVHGPNVCFVLT